jgi:hypothetical protein
VSQLRQGSKVYMQVMTSGDQCLSSNFQHNV